MIQGVIGRAVKHQITFHALGCSALKNLSLVYYCALLFLHGRIPFSTECFEITRRLRKICPFFQRRQ